MENSTKPLIILCETALEARSVVRRMRHARVRSLGLFQGWAGSMAGAPVVAVVSGAGVSESAIAAREVIRLLDPAGLIAFGAAAALTEKQKVGACGWIELARSYKAPRVIPKFEPFARPLSLKEAACDPEWLRIGREVVHMDSVRIGSADSPIHNKYMAGYLAAAWGFEWADCSSYSILNAAEQAGIPAIGIKTVAGLCGPHSAEQFDQHARKSLRRAAVLLEKLVVRLDQNRKSLASAW